MRDRSDMRDRRVLVTGGAGFIGANIANHIAAANDVTVVDDRSLGTPENLDTAVRFRNRSVLESDLPTDVDVVFHLAALSSYAMHEADPQRGVRVNVEGFVNVLEQARRDGCETVVYASTSSVYGDRTEPSPEVADVTANTGYEASKLARERYAEYFRAHHGMSVAGLRLFSVYQGYGGAERHKGGHANVIAQFADDIARGASPVLYGDGPPSTSRTRSRRRYTSTIPMRTPRSYGPKPDGNRTSGSRRESSASVRRTSEHRPTGRSNVTTGGPTATPTASPRRAQSSSRRPGSGPSRSDPG